MLQHTQLITKLFYHFMAARRLASRVLQVRREARTHTRPPTEMMRSKEEQSAHVLWEFDPAIKIWVKFLTHERRGREHN